jgi:hypothetical protein
MQEPYPSGAKGGRARPASQFRRLALALNCARGERLKGKPRLSRDTWRRIASERVGEGLDHASRQATSTNPSALTYPQRPGRSQPQATSLSSSRTSWAIPVPASSLSDSGWPGCKSVCAIHFSADSWPSAHRRLHIVEKLSSGSRLSPRPPKARQAAGPGFSPSSATPLRCPHSPSRCSASMRAASSSA